MTHFESAGAPTRLPLSRISGLLTTLGVLALATGCQGEKHDAELPQDPQTPPGAAQAPQLEVAQAEQLRPRAPVGGQVPGTLVGAPIAGVTGTLPSEPPPLDLPGMDEMPELPVAPPTRSYQGGDLALALPGQLGAGLAEARRDGHALRFDVQSLRWVRGGTVVGEVAHFGGALRVDDGARSRYRATRGEGVLDFTQRPGELVQALRLESAPALPEGGLSDDLVLELVERIEISAPLQVLEGAVHRPLPAQFESTMPLTFALQSSDAFTPVLNVATPFAMDADGVRAGGAPPSEPDNRARYAVSLDADGQGWLHTRFDARWLMDAERSYPVVLDPHIHSGFPPPRIWALNVAPTVPGSLTGVVMLVASNIFNSELDIEVIWGDGVRTQVHSADPQFLLHTYDRPGPRNVVVVVCDDAEPKRCDSSGPRLILIGPGAGQPLCGDGVVEGDEECDDGNNEDGDGCAADCQNEVGCGNGVLEPPEACDDGNLNDGDQCDASCAFETIPEGTLEIALEEVAMGLSAPVALTHAGDGSGRLFVVDQRGLIRIIDGNGTLLPTPFLDLTAALPQLGAVFDERGLLGLAFHPDYANNGRFFVRYSIPRAGAPAEPCSDPSNFVPGCHTERLSEFSVLAGDPDQADPASESVLLDLPQPQFNHNAGHLAFGPDGMLYVSYGDGGGANDGLADNPPSHGPGGNGQDTSNLLGTVLRLDVDGAAPFAIPADNPFVGGPEREEIYAYGFRNPYRFSFDAHSGELIVADVGQALFEEINSVESGGNYGWVTREGAHCFDPFAPGIPPLSCPSAGLLDPFAEYNHADGTAIVGGFVYRGSAVPELEGQYLFGDFSTGFFVPDGRLFSLDFDGDRSAISELRIAPANAPLGEFLKGFGEDEDGELYVLTSTELSPFGASGRVLRVARAGACGDGVLDPGEDCDDGNLQPGDGCDETCQLEGITVDFLLSGLQEVPPVAVQTSGNCSAVLNGAQTSLTVTCTHNVFDATAAHIHRGGVGQNGPVAIAFPAPQSPMSVTWDANSPAPLTPADVQAFLDGTLYVNVHSQGHPPGELRGQITSAPVPLPTLIPFLLSGLQEVPPVATAASGTCNAFVSAAEDSVRVDCLHDVANPTAAHIHRGGVGQNGPVAIAFPAASSPMSVTWDANSPAPLTPADVQALLDGTLYVNVHSTDSPPGELRGQITAAPVPLPTLIPFLLSGLQEVPPVASTASGTCNAFVSAAQDSVRVDCLHDVANPTAAHIHRGAVGQNGPVAIAFPAASSPMSVTWDANSPAPLTAADVQALLDGTLYVNVHSTDSPPGELRGQITAAVVPLPTLIPFLLSGLQEVPPVASTASGTCNAFLSAAEDSVRVDCLHDVANPTAAHIHRGAVGQNGPVAIAFPAATSPMSVTWDANSPAPLTAADVQALLDGTLYVNVHSTDSPPGELRGQITAAVVPLPTLIPFPLSGLQEVPPLITPASGACNAFLSAAEDSVRVDCVHDVANPTAAHIHRGAVGVNGPVAIAFPAAVSPMSVTWDGNSAAPLTPADVQALLDGTLYVNVHSTDSPPGELRGQIVGAAVPFCGDGNLDPGEQCDDGNNDAGDGCGPTCRDENCGNDVVDPGEDCDDGALNSDVDPDACRTDCTDPSCGDGVTDSGEDCDDGPLNSDSQADACRTDCSAPSCGDGVIDSGEDCDDGNNAPGDGCDGSCALEAGSGLPDCTITFDTFSGATCPDAATAVCGATFANAAANSGSSVTGTPCNVIGVGACYHSGSQSYQVTAASETIEFSDDVNRISVFFVHEVAGGSGAMRFFDVNDNEVGTALSTQVACRQAMGTLRTVNFATPVRSITVQNLGAGTLWIDSLRVNGP